MADGDAAAADAALQEVLREARARGAVAQLASITAAGLAARAEAWLGSAKDVPALLGIAAAALNCHQRTGRDGLPPACSSPGHPAWPWGEHRAIAVAVFGDAVRSLPGEASGLMTIPPGRRPFIRLLLIPCPPSWRARKERL